MATYRSVTVGTDGSLIAERAIGVAASIAGTLGVPLRIVSAWTGEGGGDTGSEEYRIARSATEKGQAIAETRGATDVATLEPTGEAVDALRQAAGDDTDGLLVVGGRGLNSLTERLGGNVADALAKDSPTDVLLVHENGPVAYASIALSTDGSTTATRAVKQGLALADGLGIAPELLSVAKDDDEGGRAMSSVLADLSLEGRELMSRVVIGSSANPGNELSQAAADYDLLVIGNRGLSGISSWLGSVSKKVTHEFATDLLIVKTAD